MLVIWNKYLAIPEECHYMNSVTCYPDAFFKDGYQMFIPYPGSNYATHAWDRILKYSRGNGLHRDVIYPSLPHVAKEITGIYYNGLNAANVYFTKHSDEDNVALDYFGASTRVVCQDLKLQQYLNFIAEVGFQRELKEDEDELSFFKSVANKLFQYYNERAVPQVESFIVYSIDTMNQIETCKIDTDEGSIKPYSTVKAEYLKRKLEEAEANEVKPKRKRKTKRGGKVND